ncbi:MAG: LmeA family phospholipid-binding protein [Nitrospira sp.]|nr:LmeA family phospholipid-binding protein [Nitrospira sp.]
MRLQASSLHETAVLTCPKCSFEQEEGLECLRCGIIFSKFKSPARVVEKETACPVESKAKPETPRFWSRVFRMLPWISLTLTAGVLLLILRQAPPLPIQADPQAADRVAGKMAQLQLAMALSQRHSTTLNEAELNQWMRDNLAIASTHQARQAGIPVPAGHEAEVQEVQSALKDVRMNLTGNQLKAYALFVLYGKEISLQLDGTIETRDGGIRLKPTAGKLGSMPIPSSTLDRVAQQLFESNQNREKFQLPSQIESVRIENGTLVIATR